MAILDSDNILVTRYNLNPEPEGHDLNHEANYQALRELLVDTALTDLARSWHNPEIAMDVNDDGFVSPIDALLVVNLVHRVGPDTTAALQNIGHRAQPYYDCSGDLTVSLDDAQSVLDYLNQFNRVVSITATGGSGRSGATVSAPSDAISILAGELAGPIQGNTENRLPEPTVNEGVPFDSVSTVANESIARKRFGAEEATSPATTTATDAVPARTVEEAEARDAAVSGVQGVVRTERSDAWVA